MFEAPNNERPIVAEETPRRRPREDIQALIQELIDADTALEDVIRCGEEARKRHEIEKARALFEHVLEREPDHARALSELGFIYLEVGDHVQASSLLERSLDRDPDDERSIYGAALAWLGREEFDAALNHALRLVDSRKLSSRRNGHFIAGKVLYESGAFERAAEEFERAIALEKKARAKQRRQAETRFLLAQAYLALGDKNSALERLRDLQELTWRRSIADQIGRLCLELDRITEAKEAFQAILDRSPDDQRALRGLGQVYLEEHRHDDAIEVFERAHKLDPDSPQVLEGLAEAYKGKGDLSRAARYIEDIRKRSDMPEALLERRLRALDRERARRDAELLRVRNLAALNAMATGIAHELRQPLTVIRLAAQNARRDLIDGRTEHLNEDLGDIDASVGRLDRIIELLRQLSTAGSSNPEPLNVTLAVDRALEFFQEQFRSRDIEVTCNELDHEVVADEAALVQILINLLGNARDAMSASSTRRIQLWAVSAPNRVQLFVKDSGAGMTRDVEKRAFDPFYTTKGTQGVGMGLYIAYQLAKKMNAQLALKQTKRNQGTTFELTLPRHTPGRDSHD